MRGMAVFMIYVCFFAVKKREEEYRCCCSTRSIKIALYSLSGVEKKKMVAIVCWMLCCCIAFAIKNTSAATRVENISS